MRIRYSFSSRRTGTIEGNNKHRIAFPKIVLEVVRISDVILEVLDARFPQETRNLELEELIKKQGKKIIYILNKADLVNHEEIRKKIELLNLYPYVLVSCLEKRGSKDLRDRIKMEIKKLEITQERKQVGVIGYPNTGKSSLINFLVGRAAAGTAAVAGFTKGIQKIKLSTGILILDTPGVIPDNEDANTSVKDMTKHTKINVRTYDKVKQPDFMVHNLMTEYPGVFEKFYGIEANGNSEILIEELGRKKGMLKKGNIVDFDRTARLILKDMQDGKIKL